MRLRLEHILAAIAAVGILVVIGAVSVWAGHPWMVPSVGAAAFVQTMSPDIPSAKPWNTFMGQVVAIIGGFAGIYAIGAQHAATFASGQPLVWTRVAAVAVGIGCTVLLQHLLRAENPTGGATTLLIALGAEPPTWQGAAILLVGITLVTVLGESARFALLALRRP